MMYEAVKREAEMRADALQTQRDQLQTSLADLARREADLRRQIEDLAAVYARLTTFLRLSNTHCFWCGFVRLLFSDRHVSRGCGRCRSALSPWSMWNATCRLATNRAFLCERLQVR